MTLIEKEELSKTLPLIELDKFENRVKELEKINWKVERLIQSLGSWENLQEHLRIDLFCRISAKPIINKY